MLAATFLAIFFVPLFYVLIQRVTKFFIGRRAVDPESDARVVAQRADRSSPTA
jgi:hypothetical protein